MKVLQGSFYDVFVTFLSTDHEIIFFAQAPRRKVSLAADHQAIWLHVQPIRTVSSSKKSTIGPHHTKPCLWAYADSEGPEQPAHPQSLVRTFTVR